MRRTVQLIILLGLAPLWVIGQSFSLLTWNIRDLGQTKNDWELFEMASIMKSHDVIAIQEVVAKHPGGAKAVAKLAELLNRMGNRWDFRISDPTQSPNSYLSERYAFIWKTSSIRLMGRPHLDKALAHLCHREPYIGQFQEKRSGQVFFLVNFHSRRFDQGPEKEIRHFSQYPAQFAEAPVIIAGDFNLDEQHPVWSKLYDQSYTSAISRSPTTLKRKCNLYGRYLNHSIDNIYYPTAHFRILRAGKIDFVKECEALTHARGISDHLPVFLRLISDNNN